MAIAKDAVISGDRKGYGTYLEGDDAILIQTLARDNDMSLRDVMFDAVQEYKKAIESGHVPVKVEHERAPRINRSAELQSEIEALRAEIARMKSETEAVDEAPPVAKKKLKK